MAESSQRRAATMAGARPRAWKAIAAVTALMAAVVAGDLNAQAAGQLKSSSVSVIDGDTIEIHGQRVRLHGVDAPESAQLCETNGERYKCGQRAALALADKIRDKTVRCSPRDQDRYGRIVAVCVAGGEDLGGWMVLNGWAVAYRHYTFDYVKHEEAARAAGVGIWRGAFAMPWDWRAAQRPKRARTSARGGDMDCSDFSSWRDAQDFYTAAGPGDPHRLDGDRDGVACESLRW